MSLFRISYRFGPYVHVDQAVGFALRLGVATFVAGILVGLLLAGS